MSDKNEMMQQIWLLNEFVNTLQEADDLARRLMQKKDCLQNACTLFSGDTPEGRFLTKETDHALAAIKASGTLLNQVAGTLPIKEGEC